MPKETGNITNSNQPNSRILARHLARELTRDELDDVSGGYNCTDSSCLASDNSSCDQDVCGDNGFPP